MAHRNERHPLLQQLLIATSCLGNIHLNCSQQTFELPLPEGGKLFPALVPILFLDILQNLGIWLGMQLGIQLGSWVYSMRLGIQLGMQLGIQYTTGYTSGKYTSQNLGIGYPVTSPSLKL
jgi:hypothetical protein